jgi:hypothetical protein
LFAGLATLRFILQTLVVEKSLFPGCPDEILVAVHTPDTAIRMFGI